MAKVEITGAMMDTVLKIDGVEMKDAFKYELTGDCEALPVIKVSVLVTDLVVDIDEVEGLIERVPLSTGKKKEAASA
ncbi:MAG TPA: hypothetical protein VEB19_06220 [Gemmatimonadaceae bacterium]|nr:hypothetical protein [Gemmatimonadaceae bacterium]